ncbi:MAG: hypothetical protein ABW020_06945 [Candidatus Rokuibacteriota bacterium]
MRDAGRAIRAVSDARDLCLSLKRAFVGPRALERLRAGEAGLLSGEELHVGLGLAWAAGDRGLVRDALARVGRERVEADAVLTALREAAREP